MGATLRSNLPKLAAEAQSKAGRAVQKTVHDVQGHAQTNAPVDTGSLRASIGAEMTGPLSGVVPSHAEYSMYVEYGTSRMGAQPFLTPAAETVRPGFEAAMKRIVS